MVAIITYLKNYFEKHEPKDKKKLDVALQAHDKKMGKLQTQKDELTKMLDRMVRKRRTMK